MPLQGLKVTAKDIVEFIMFPVVNEACRVLDEGVVVRASDLDIATCMSMGFPPYRYETVGDIGLCARVKKCGLGIVWKPLVRCWQGWSCLLGGHNWG